MEIINQNQQIKELTPQNQGGEFSQSEMISVNQTQGEVKKDDFDISNIQGIVPTFEMHLNQMLEPDVIDFSLDDIDFAETYSIQTEEITEDDAKICLKIIEENKLATLPQNVSEIINNQVRVEDVEQIKGASRILEAVKTAALKNKPIRLDFDNNITLVMRVNDGKINAQFYPNDNVAEQYLKNNITYLKNRFDLEGIPYSNLSYNQDRRKEQQERQDKR